MASAPAPAHGPDEQRGRDRKGILRLHAVVPGACRPASVRVRVAGRGGLSACTGRGCAGAAIGPATDGARLLPPGRLWQWLAARSGLAGTVRAAARVQLRWTAVCFSARQLAFCYPADATRV